MKIKVWDYLVEYEKEKDEINETIQQVLTSGNLILGDKVKQFEGDFSKYCGVRYGVGVGNGTDAIFLALKSLNIGKGDEVITVPNTAVPTVSAITATGATPVFVDVNPETFLIDASQIERTITKRTKLILPVHLYGQCADMTEISRIAERNDIFILEDCAQSHGAEYDGKKAGSMSDVATFSFYPTKILGTFGDGGMIITNDPEKAEKLRRLRFYGMEKTYYSLEQGYNSRLDELHAAILLCKLAHIDEYISRRRSIAAQYNDQLSETGLILPTETPGNKHAYYLYVVRHPKRDIIIEELKKDDIFVNISYPWPIHIMPGFKELGYREGDFPVAEKLAREIFSLPMYPSLTGEQQEKVVRSLKTILKKII